MKGADVAGGAQCDAAEEDPHGVQEPGAGARLSQKKVQRARDGLRRRQRLNETQIIRHSHTQRELVFYYLIRCLALFFI